MQEGHFAPSSMNPKIQACINFLENGGKQALITNPENIELALQDKTGTRIVPDKRKGAKDNLWER
jgi:carbamate kinase